MLNTYLLQMLRWSVSKPTIAKTEGEQLPEHNIDESDDGDRSAIDDLLAKLKQTERESWARWDS